MTDYRLYGMPGSLYTAKARSYLIKQRIDFEEDIPAAAAWLEITKEIGRWIIPVLVTPTGAIIQDGAAIIDHIEAIGLARRSAYPDTPVHRAVSLVFELFGGEGLLRPAMHYRWDYDADNRDFLKADFVAALMPGATDEVAEAVFGAAGGRMRKAKQGFGVSAETAPVIQASYEAFLALLDAHLALHPYLLGGQPTIGDYGLIGPLYAHLARDPYPAALMKARFYNVWRWTERMNAAQALLDGKYAAETLIAGDAVPDTLVALLRFIAEDYLPELVAHVDFANQWLDGHPDLQTGTNGLPDPATRAIGRASFDWHGVTIASMVMPYRFYLLQRVQAAIAAAGPPIAAILTDAGLAALATLQTHRPVERVGHLEVWGADRRA
ncbi:glutathione S-transferase C-terminal domain-containing protein [Sphingomonas sp. 28-63-12]|uniref:glutathione S-transferase C-terminal domain-containing protein n=1 Tax=Sphingomonas sp. 28-63-12 TaxID=1970434 RepID=UPI000BC84A30|nr:MAG: hypothetical protein B7Y47_07610 [Sphingomonas sp. 28-63-12]